MPCYVNCIVDAVHPYSPISRQVQPDEGEELAKSNKAAWVETSAKNNVNVGTYTLLNAVRTSHLKRLLGRVFELCLAEIEKRSPHSQTDQPEASRCVVM